MNLLSHDALSPDGTLAFGSLAGKYPIIVGAVACHFSATPSTSRRAEGPSGSASHEDSVLHLTDDSVDDGAHDVDFAAVEIQVAPAQAEEFALPQTSCDIEKDQETRKGSDVV